MTSCHSVFSGNKWVSKLLYPQQHLPLHAPLPVANVLSRSEKRSDDAMESSFIVAQKAVLDVSCILLI